MKAPEDHLPYLRQNFRLGCTNIFNNQELTILKQYGCWMEALEKGEIQPITSEQERFIKVACGEISPQTVYEQTWWKLKSRRKFEKENLQSPHYTLSVDRKLSQKFLFVTKISYL